MISPRNQTFVEFVDVDVSSFDVSTSSSKARAFPLILMMALVNAKIVDVLPVPLQVKGLQAHNSTKNTLLLSLHSIAVFVLEKGETKKPKTVFKKRDKLTEDPE